MRIDAYRGGRRGPRLLAAVAVLGISALACGGAPAMGGVGNGGQAATSTCGEGTGLKAGGTPVKLGGIVTALQGEDFTPITSMARGYFNCVNDNGGINGHPIEYTVENDQGNPAVAQADATDLIEKQGILAMVGNTSIVDCGANHTYYEQHGFDVVGASLEDTCHTTPNYATVNMGPNYSTQGAVQYVVSKGANNVVIDTAALGGAGAAQVQWGIDFAHSKGLPARIDLDNTPIMDPAGVAKRVVQEAGPGGAVVLNFTTPEGLKVLQGAEQQGLVNSVRAWGWSTPGNDASVAQALDGAWNGKLGVNAELNLTNATGPDSTLYRQVVRQYA
ncbi:MAG: ABC transporter substrate-binding protein, partial [Candidatus Dormibacteraeota bacterium]|nr:ABC transporter substrate-binding protein [Candidatus Dormibacteraeota bacterium]